MHQFNAIEVLAEKKVRLNRTRSLGSVVQLRTCTTLDADILLKLAGRRSQRRREHSEERNKITLPRPVGSNQNVDRPEIEIHQLADALESAQCDSPKLRIHAAAPATPSPPPRP